MIHRVKLAHVMHPLERALFHVVRADGNGHVLLFGIRAESVAASPSRARAVITEKDTALAHVSKAGLVRWQYALLFSLFCGRVVRVLAK